MDEEYSFSDPTDAQHHPGRTPKFEGWFELVVVILVVGAVMRTLISTFL